MKTHRWLPRGSCVRHLSIFAALAWLAGPAAAQQTTSATTVEQQGAPGAPSLPLWELGVAGFIGSIEDYPASGHNRLRALPAPYAVYRGSFLRSDRDGLRVSALRQRTVELDISVGASFSSSSDSNGARAGMPNLDYLFEAGPNLRVNLLRTADNSRLVLSLPVRAVASTDFSRFDHRGFLFAPRLGWRDASLFGTRWQGGAGFGPDFGTARLNDYFYEVAPQYATPTRPAYNATGGYMGSHLDLSASRALTPHVRLFLGTRFDLYTGAANADSPLFRSDTGYGAFVGFTWSILQSERRVAGEN